ncbi:MAG: hypothetical protein JW849_03570 [Phycisphaerae bacterium]|nr:hypothetical protein [Phycisphaerae bacterium]
MIRRIAIFGMSAALLLAATGCQKPHPPLSTIQPPEVVLADYNTAAGRVPRLWARAQITYKESATALPLTAAGLLTLQKPADPTQPADFFLKFSEAGNEIGRLGVSTADGVYYAWFQVGDKQSCRWGQLALAGAPGVKDMPIDPTQLPAVLSICQLPADPTRPPFVAQRISFDPCAYVLTFVDRQPITGRFLFKREIYLHWSTDQPRRAFRVDLLDENGLAVLSADLRNYQPFAMEDVENTAPPAEMPTDILLRWRKTGGELRLKLSNMTTADRVDPEAYLFWDRLPRRLKSCAKQIDAHLSPADAPAVKGTPAP